MHDAAHDPALVTNNPIFGRAENPSGFDYPAAGAIATIPQIERAPPLAAPLLGAQSEEILAERLGLTTHMIGELHAKGIVGLAHKGTDQ
jgi:2-methylfumaryl-CoA isomerase